MPGPQIHQSYQVGDFKVITGERRLLRDGTPVAIGPKPFDALVLLLENAGTLVDRSTFRERLWSGLIVEDATMSRVIADLRKALGEQGRAWIETVPKFGYRLTLPAEVPELADRTVVEAANNPPRQETLTKGVNRSYWAFAAALLLLGIGGFANLQLASPKPGPKPQSLLVLPFEIIGPVQDAELLRTGLQDSLTTELSGLSRLVVRKLPANVQTDQIAPTETGKRYQSSAVLLGSIQERGDLVHISARLISTDTGLAIWADVQEETSDNLFQLEDLIAKRVSAALLPALSAGERAHLSLYHPGNPIAHKFYTLGRFYWNRRNEAGYRQALEMFRHAADADPGFALAPLGMADVYLLNNASPLPLSERLALARGALQKALSLNPELGEAHSTLGLIAEGFDLDWQRADLEFRTAVRLTPNYATAHHWYGELLSMMGMWKQAEAEFEKACELDPLSAIILTDLAQLHYFHGEYDRSIATLREALRLDPNFHLAHERIGWTLMALGRATDARSEFAASTPIHDANLEGFHDAWLAAVSGHRGPALDWIHRAELRQTNPFAIAVIRSAIGDRSGAIENLEQAYQKDAAGLISLKVNPAFHTLRYDARFNALLSKMGLQ